MKRRLLLIIGFQYLCLAGLFAQSGLITSITFTYDESGNRKTREVIYYQGGLKSAQIVKEEEKIEIERECNVYPNPASNCLYVTLNDEALEADDCIIILYNNLGKRLLQINAVQDINKIDVSNLANSTYILKLIYDTKQLEWIIIKN